MLPLPSKSRASMPMIVYLPWLMMIAAARLTELSG
jgi:hypothetical protein